MTGRRKSRELALSVLYSIELNPGMIEERAGNLKPASMDREAADFAVKLAAGVLDQAAYLDRTTNRLALHWRLERLAVVDRNILRVAIYEMVFLQPEIPWKVAINEAVELAKKFGSEESYRFVNGILNRLKEELEAEKQGEPGNAR